jgi:hypothetical protein
MLSIRLDIQQTIREEIRAISPSHRRLTLDAISSLPWLDAVLKETMRLFVP